MQIKGTKTKSKKLQKVWLLQFCFFFKHDYFQEIIMQL